MANSVTALNDGSPIFTVLVLRFRQICKKMEEAQRPVRQKDVFQKAVLELYELNLRDDNI